MAEKVNSRNLRWPPKQMLLQKGWMNIAMASRLGEMVEKRTGSPRFLKMGGTHSQFSITSCLMGSYSLLNIYQANRMSKQTESLGMPGILQTWNFIAQSNNLDIQQPSLYPGCAINFKCSMKVPSKHHSNRCNATVFEQNVSIRYPLQSDKLHSEKRRSRKGRTGGNSYTNMANTALVSSSVRDINVMPTAVESLPELLFGSRGNKRSLVKTSREN